MTSEGWAEVAAMAAAASAFLNLCGTFFVWQSSKTQAKSADFDSCIRTIAAIAEGLRKVRDAASDSALLEYEMREYLNLLEGFALLANRGKITPVASELVMDFLKESVAFMKSNDPWKAVWDTSITGKNTYRELQRLIKRQAPSQGSPQNALGGI